MPLALTMGDPAGIGPDLALDAWRHRDRTDVPPFIVLGDPDLLAARAATLGLDVPLAPLDKATDARVAWNEALPVMPVRLAEPVQAGTPNAAAGPAVIEAIEAGVDMIRAGEARALVTNPINKHVLYQTGFQFPGHTEFLAALSKPWNVNVRPVMMLASQELRVVPVTIHIPLKNVAAALTKELITETVEITARGLQGYFGISAPRIAVAGLNPHAGESGSLGAEEIEIIAPAIQDLALHGLHVTGPHPADALFHEAARATYDAVVAMYHDQALVPIKTLAFDRAVNLTLGLPFVRTSPDHGTAYGLAGTGKARPDSLIEALKLAGAICERQAAAA